MTDDLNPVIERAIEAVRANNGREPEPVEEFHVTSGVPVYLYIVRPNGDFIEIDLEEPQWMKTHAEWMRGRARWYLMTKPIPVAPSRGLLAVDVQEDDQPFYTARHIVRVKGPNAGSQITAFSIGAKRAGGHTDRLWVLPNGLVCGGEDVDSLGDAFIDALNN